MSAPAVTDLKQEILELEKKNWEAWMARDAKILESLIDDQYLMVMDEGITDKGKSEFVSMMLDGDKACPEMEQAGKTMSTDYFFTTTYVKKGDTWVGAVGSASKAAAPKNSA